MVYYLTHLKARMAQKVLPKLIKPSKRVLRCGISATVSFLRERPVYAVILPKMDVIKRKGTGTTRRGGE